MLEDEFRKAKNRCITLNGDFVCLYDEFSVPSQFKLLLKFHSASSEWRQGVRIGEMSSKSRLKLVANNQVATGMQLWSDTSPSEVEIMIEAPACNLCIYNIWDKGNNQSSSMIAGAGMIIEVSTDGLTRKYRCNDGHENVTFDHLVFSCTVEK